MKRKLKISLILALLALLCALMFSACDVVAHQHTYSDEWTSNELFHWHASTCGHSVVDGREKHDFEASEGGTCSVCGYVNEEEQHIHSLTKVAAVDSNCLHEGNVEHYVCNSCGKIFADNDGKTELDKKSVVVAKKEHYFSVWTVTKQATESENGEETSYCEFCNTKTTRSIQKVTVETLQIARFPNVTDYVCGEEFDPTGLKVVATYSDGSEKEITTYSLSNQAQLDEKVKKIVVSYKGLTAEIEINVASLGEVLSETAFGYYYRGADIHYDQKGSRQNRDIAPEEAFEGKRIYLDCSSFVNAVYKNAFGVNVMNNTLIASTYNYNKYAAENLGKKVDVVGYWVNADYSTEAKRSALLAEVRDSLQVGDVLTYRHGTTSAANDVKSGGNSGHVYVYVGGDVGFLHCTGSSFNNAGYDSSYDYATKAEYNGGAIQTMSLDNVFANSTHSRYLFRDFGKNTSNTVVSFSLLRPLARNLSATEQAVCRQKIRGLRLEKTVSIGNNASATSADEVIYTLNVVNKSDRTVEKIVIADVVPQGATYVSGSLTTGSYADGKISSILSVAANGKVSVSYKVRFDGTQKTVVAASATCGGLKFNTVKNTYSPISASTMANFVQNARTLVGKVYSSSYAMAVEAYAFIDLTMFTYKTVSGAIGGAIEITSESTSEGKLRTDTGISKAVVFDMYGGTDLATTMKTDNLRERYVKLTYLSVGDVILGINDKGSFVYVYLGNNEGLFAYDGGAASVKMAYDEGETTFGNYFTDKTFLAKLSACNRYVVVRPSLK